MPVRYYRGGAGPHDGLDLGQRLEDPGVQDLFPEGPVEALDEGVLIQFPGFD